MDKNYYDILEINKNASPEIIEKAYKTLVKKYHPDLQENNLKNKYEEKIKLINEAYEILSNPEKRKNYDLNLKSNEITEDEYNILYNENINLKNEINNLKNINNNINKNIVNNSNNIINQKNNTFNNNGQQNNNYYKNQNNINEDIYNKKINDAINKAYYDAYIQDLKNRGYKISYKKTWKDLLALLITIILFIIIGFILWHIPVTKNYLINLYNENPILQFFVNLIFNK